MPILRAIRQLGHQPTRLPTATLASEPQLGDMLVREPAILKFCIGK